MIVTVEAALRVLALTWTLLASHQRCVFVLLVGMVTTVQSVSYFFRLNLMCDVLTSVLHVMIVLS